MLSSTFPIIRAYARMMRENDVGATAVEYGLILALIAAVIVGALVTLGPDLSNVFTNLQGHLTTPTTP